MQEVTYAIPPIDSAILNVARGDEKHPAQAVVLKNGRGDLEVIQVAIVKGHEGGVGRQLFRALEVSDDLIDADDIEVAPQRLTLGIEGVRPDINDSAIERVVRRRLKDPMIREHREVGAAKTRTRLQDTFDEACAIEETTQTLSGRSHSATIPRWLTAGQRARYPPTIRMRGRSTRVISQACTATSMQTFRASPSGWQAKQHQEATTLLATVGGTNCAAEAAPPRVRFSERGAGKSYVLKASVRRAEGPAFRPVPRVPISHLRDSNQSINHLILLEIIQGAPISSHTKHAVDSSEGKHIFGFVVAMHQ